MPKLKSQTSTRQATLGCTPNIS